MDVAVLNTLNGGDIQVIGNDLASQNGWGNMVFLGLFGGNIDAVTDNNRVATQEANDFWGNTVLFPQDSDKQFNSTTEKTLKTVALNSSGRVKIEQAVKNDLAFMQSFANITVLVKIVSDDRIEIGIKVEEPENLNGRLPDQYRQFVLIWDATKQEIGDFRILDFNDDFFV